MKVLLSSIGTRGDVQPILALARELQAGGHVAALCVAPNFKEWIESFGLTCIPIGPDLKQLASPSSQRPTPEQMRALAAQSVRDQFQVMEAAAAGFDLILAAGALQIATRSVTELLGIPYVFAAYAPVAFPSSDHAPAMTTSASKQSLQTDNLALWESEANRWNELFLGTLNEERAKRDLPPAADIMRHIFTDEVWLATDRVLGPAPSHTEVRVVQKGAWLMRDDSELPDSLQRFLDCGEPPIYFGFGSMRGADPAAPIFLEAARAVGRRAVFSQGWGNLTAPASDDDCISIGDVNHAKLFTRIAAAVHHGGAGTTHAAARAGCTQVIVPHTYDQFYWAQRVRELDVGAEGCAREQLTIESLIEDLQHALQASKASQARHIAGCIDLCGTQTTTQALLDRFG